MYYKEETITVLFMFNNGKTPYLHENQIHFTQTFCNSISLFCFNDHCLWYDNILCIYMQNHPVQVHSFKCGLII
jgi:hypothetical protein